MQQSQFRYPKQFSLQKFFEMEVKFVFTSLRRILWMKLLIQFFNMLILKRKNTEKNKRFLDKTFVCSSTTVLNMTHTLWCTIKHTPCSDTTAYWRKWPDTHCTDTTANLLLSRHTIGYPNCVSTVSLLIDYRSRSS